MIINEQLMSRVTIPMQGIILNCLRESLPKVKYDEMI